MHFVLVFVFGLFIFLVYLPALNRWHRQQFGVDMPSQNARRRIRQNARQKGIGVNAAHDQWVRNKTRRGGSAAPIGGRPIGVHPIVNEELPTAAMKGGAVRAVVRWGLILVGVTLSIPILAVVMALVTATW
jgi:hypothetical protein